ncbi:TusE/DsrC/DsvC family sulfur relay protein [Cellvibrio japonicus]|nr:TusE/DsrC/DsvC family sulfur relay protein [Cellvibrio japonicus]QEI12186.1 TusE/DsrC/DsvC family sulfur relay protein [Cellvibrio japonicus]QEI15760.1 TusE/DsrC/DsvC family sulfur relay protein [Cellvibrio japonicus]QEI19338.1 TusE/DsrC/DsvC family sulfur relay protein [Cellvibrio japonicus]
MSFVVNNLEIPTDDDGYLLNLADWTPQVAEALAEQEQLVLTQAHWEILNLLRDFYRTYELSPAMRALVKHTAKTLGEEKGRSLYLLQLFPPSPAKIASKIAGLPRPTNCL